MEFAWPGKHGLRVHAGKSTLRTPLDKNVVCDNRKRTLFQPTSRQLSPSPVSPDHAEVI